jgi:hypothetical protein
MMVLAVVVGALALDALLVWFIRRRLAAGKM